MLNYIWLGLILFAVVIGGVTGHIKDVSDGAFNMAETAVMKLALPLTGLMALWLGIMRLAEKSGMVHLVARALRPLLTRLFPDVPPDHPAMGSMVMNIAANMLGLSNAATPLGLRAMKDLESLNTRPGTATNAMCTFLAINTSGIQLVSVTAVGLLAVNKSKDPSSIILPSFLSSSCAAIAAIMMVKFLEKLPLFRLPQPAQVEETKKKEQTAEAEAAQPAALPPLEWWGVLALVTLIAFFIGLTVALLAVPERFPNLPYEPGKDGPIISLIKTISLLSVPFLVSFFPLYAAVRRIKVYEEFVEGAKEGFQVVLRIIPYLVTILVAIGMFRGSGGIDMLTKWLTPAMNFVHFPPELLPMAFIRPLSGSGSLGVLSDIVTHYGPDNILSKMAATIYGSTETTFYVLAVYFGSVNVKRSRHAVLAGLTADVVGILAAVTICRLVFR